MRSAPTRERGGIGRRTGFRFQRPQGRESSSLSVRTTFKILNGTTELESVINDLKALPPSNPERAADYIHRLKLVTDQERHAITGRTAGSLTCEESDELERIIAEGCEQPD
jgi:hypothetical protein